MSGEAYPDIPTNALSLLRTYLHHAVTIFHFTLDQDLKSGTLLLVWCVILGFFPFRDVGFAPSIISIKFLHTVLPLPHKETNGSCVLITHICFYCRYIGNQKNVNLS